MSGLLQNPSNFSRTFLFSITLFLSAALMFIVQLIIGKMMLPMVGGTPSGWLVAMSYFQLALLAGYAGAHVLTRFSPALHISIVIAVLVAGFLMLPLHLGGGLAEKLSPMAGDVIWSLLVSITIPFLGLSMMSPSLQRLFAAGTQRDPYFLFAASNLGSFAGLLSYPLVIERVIGLTVQREMWQAGYIALIVLCGCCFFLSDRKFGVTSAKLNKIFDIEWRTGLKWIGLAFIPSSLTLGITAQITMDGGALPFFWVLPLGFYLLTFVLAFSRFNAALKGPVAFLYPMGLALAFFTFVQQPYMIAWNIADVLPQFIAFCLVTLFCHLRLAEVRPEPQKLTGYYLCVSIGGALGGFFNVFIVPHIFPMPFEFIIVAFTSCLLFAPRPWTNASWLKVGLPIAVAVAVVIMVWLNQLGVGITRGIVRLSLLSEIGLIASFSMLAWCATRKVPLAEKKFELVCLFALAAGGLVYQIMTSTALASGLYLSLAGALMVSLAVLALQPKIFLQAAVLMGLLALVISNPSALLEVKRNFFGILHVRTVQGKDYVARYFSNGSTVHGIQKVEPQIDNTPVSYYAPVGPLGDIMEISKPHDVGMIGMGAGTTVCYQAKNRHYTIYDINPNVPVLAEKWFYFFKNCGMPEIKLGDGRKLLEAAEGTQHDLLIVDAFSSDAIPVHLLTKEAVQTYFDRLAPNGVLALHLTNRYYTLMRTAGAIAHELKVWTYFKFHNPMPTEPLVFPSLWVILVKPGSEVGPYLERGWEVFPALADDLWTDDFSNPISLINMQAIWKELTDAQKN